GEVLELIGEPDHLLLVAGRFFAGGLQPRVDRAQRRRERFDFTAHELQLGFKASECLPAVTDLRLEGEEGALRGARAGCQAFEVDVHSDCLITHLPAPNRDPTRTNDTSTCPRMSSPARPSADS